MTSVKCTIYDKRLGFTLDKTKLTPTIDKITPGGALERESIENCYDITKGTQLMTIGGYDVMNMNYDEAVEKIKSLNERPLTVVFLTNKVPEKISESTMNDISEVATKQALRDLAKSQLGKYNELNESVDVTDSSDDDEHYVTIQKYEELEKKYHYLQLDMLNTKHSYDDKCEYIENKYLPISNVDGIMCQIVNLKQRFNKLDDTKQTSRELSDKLEKCMVEYDEYIRTLENSLKLVKLNMIQKSIEMYIENETLEMTKLCNRYKYNIMFKNFIELFESCCVLVVLFGFVYSMVY
tara:strand:- start:302 stop:1186 length:885 start_codon:yes stop_codon:yes gene_type:complete